MLMQGLAVPNPPISSTVPLLPAEQLQKTPPRPDHGVAVELMEEPEVVPLPPIQTEQSTSGVDASSGSKFLKV